MSAIQSDWDSVKSAASDLKNATTSELDDAWSSFEFAVDDVPSDASVSDALNDVSSSAQAFASSASSAQWTLFGPDCS